MSCGAWRLGPAPARRPEQPTRGATRAAVALYRSGRGTLRLPLGGRHHTVCDSPLNGGRLTSDGAPLPRHAHTRTDTASQTVPCTATRRQAVVSCADTPPRLKTTHHIMHAPSMRATRALRHGDTSATRPCTWAWGVANMRRAHITTQRITARSLQKSPRGGRVLIAQVDDRAERVSLPLRSAEHCVQPSV